MNTLNAILNIKRNYQNSVCSSESASNRMNNMGVALEEYVKNAYANGNDHDEVFSYQGSNNNPPDMILRDGDAIEVKKIESRGGEIQLNSSYPKRKLSSTDSRINENCRSCEDNWTEKDFLYVIGQVKSTVLKEIHLIYGDCYSANESYYSDIYSSIKDQLNDNLEEYVETNELGRVNSCDPQGNTKLRIRGMWLLKHPRNIFNYPNDNNNNIFQLFSLMTNEKYNSFSAKSRNEIENENEVQINKKFSYPNPNDNSNRLTGVLISFIVMND